MSTPLSTMMTLAPVCATPAASASRTPCAPGNSGRYAGWVLTMRGDHASTSVGGQQPHEPAQHDEVGLPDGELGAELGAPLLAAVELRRHGTMNDGMPYSSACAKPSASRSAPTTTIARREVGIGRRIEQSPQIRPGARDEDGDREHPPSLPADRRLSPGGVTRSRPARRAVARAGRSARSDRRLPRRRRGAASARRRGPHRPSVGRTARRLRGDRSMRPRAPPRPDPPPWPARRRSTARSDTPRHRRRVVRRALAARRSGARAAGSRRRAAPRAPRRARPGRARGRTRRAGRARASRRRRRRGARPHRRRAGRFPR